MRAEFYKKSNKTVALYNYTQIVDIDISYYDDVLLSKAIVPEFKVSFFYTHEHERTSGELKLFSQWWDSFKRNNDFDDLYICVYDRNGDFLADGEVFEYEENLSKFCVEFLCCPDLSQILEAGNESGYNIYYSYSMSNAEKNLTWVRKIFYYEMCRAYNWTGLNSHVPLQWEGDSDYAHFDFLAKPVLSILSSFDNQYTNYCLRFSFVQHTGTPIKDILKEISKFFKVKIIYSNKNKCFNISPCINTSGQIVTGYVDSIRHRVISISDKQNLYSDIRSSYSNGSGNYQNYTNIINNIVNPSLTWIGKEKEYKIWGYCYKLLTTGNVINLNSRKFIINEISYETENLDSVKSFLASCSEV